MEHSDRDNTFETLLARDGRLVYKTRGISMKPMLYENRDLVIISVPQGRLQPYDVALYRRGSAQKRRRAGRVLPVYGRGQRRGRRVFLLPEYRPRNAGSVRGDRRLL